MMANQPSTSPEPRYLPTLTILDPPTLKPPQPRLPQAGPLQRRQRRAGAQQRGQVLLSTAGHGAAADDLGGLRVPNTRNGATTRSSDH